MQYIFHFFRFQAYFMTHRSNENGLKFDVHQTKFHYTLLSIIPLNTLHVESHQLFLPEECANNTRCVVQARHALDNMMNLRHMMYSQAKLGAQRCWHATVQFKVCSLWHCVELFNWHCFFFYVSGIKEYRGWWRWRWGGRGGWPDPASSSICTKKSHSRIQAGLSWNIPGNKTPFD